MWFVILLQILTFTIVCLSMRNLVDVEERMTMLVEHYGGIINQYINKYLNKGDY